MDQTAKDQVLSEIAELEFNFGNLSAELDEVASEEPLNTKRYNIY